MRIIVFDIDGTLTDTTRVDDFCFFQAFEETFGLDVSHMDWDSFPHVTDTAITVEIVRRHMGRELREGELDRMKIAFVKALGDELARDSSQFTPVPGASVIIEELRRIPEISLGVATGSWKESGLFKLRSIGVDISEMAFSHSDAYNTRAEICLDAIHQAARGELWRKELVTYFGDGLWDMRTCAELGVRFIGIDAHGNGKLAANGVAEVFENYTNLEAVLASLNLP